MLLPLSFTGGAANASFVSSADQSQTINYNPLFQVGSGTITASPSDTATQSPSASSSGTVVPAQLLSSTAAAAAPAASSSLILWLLIGGAVLLLAGGGKR